MHEHLFNVEKKTFSFLEDILSETLDLFPSPYIHLGVDEAVKGQWKSSPRIQQRMKEFGVETEEELQSYFVQRMEAYLQKHGRKMIGWDEILEGGLSPSTTVMSWRGVSGGIEAAEQGRDVIMTPGPTLYFDFAQSSLPDEPPGRPAPNVQTLEMVYGFEPVPSQLNANESKHIIGVSGQYLDRTYQNH